jgi:hypothetical protein
MRRGVIQRAINLINTSAVDGGETPHELVYGTASKTMDAPMRIFRSSSSAQLVDSNRPLTHADPVAHHYALQILNPPDSDESESSDLNDAELIEAITESTCINTVDLWVEPAVAMMVAQLKFTILRSNTATSVVLFSDRSFRVFFTCDVDEAQHRLWTSAHPDYSVHHDKYEAAVAFQPHPLPTNEKDQIRLSFEKSKVRLQELAKKRIRKVLLTVKTIRRILNFKESIMKYEVFVPRNDSEADASPEHLRWESEQMLEWMRLQDQGTFEHNWGWPWIQKKFPSYQRKISDISFSFMCQDSSLVPNP